MRAGITPRRTLMLAGVLLAVAAAMQVVRVSASARLGERVSDLAEPGDIQMIASETCPYCQAAREWFNVNDVPFTECLIDRDASCAAAYRALMAPGTPVLIVRGRRVLGFDAKAVLEALESIPNTSTTP